ncbi:galactosyl transferase [Rhizobium sp. P44RR-XXIV]|uniref:galactosyl transferase n=1 Tax=Rhizobium sp. P44RR-XXIV TaxID=1921145 RepID=UPI00098564E2|nr:galactosyl transferase [Rhizobium sp. P44RR-XXIV]TIX90983.1 galactosyl transferase [Rhizobium sp. P44RR-XXIV]
MPSSSCRATLSLVEAEGKTLVTFVIPVRHQANSKDWPSLKRRLAQTIASISGQSNGNWRGVIVANEGADLPDLPPKFSVQRVTFPANPLYDLHSAEREQVYEAVRLDKGRRVLTGMLSARDTHFFMVVDDDDFISANIVDFVARNVTANGWKIDRGYLWSEGGRLLLHHDDFANYCGTSLITRSDLYRLPAAFEDAGVDYIKSMLGSHVRIGKLLADAGSPLGSLPFRGAIYRVGHSGAHSKSPNLFRAYFLNRSILRHPGQLLRNLKRMRLLSRVLQDEFFGVEANGIGERQGSRPTGVAPAV